MTPYARASLALRLKEVIAARAKARMLAGKPIDPVQNSAQGKTRDALAAAADVSHDTIHKVEVVERDAPEPVKAAARCAGECTKSVTVEW